MRIGFFENAASLYGGSVYENMARDALSTEHNVVSYCARPWMKYGYRPQAILRTAILDRMVHVDLWVRNEIALTCMIPNYRCQQVGIIHHLQPSVGPSRVINQTLYRSLIKGAKRCKWIVVVSEFWKRKIESLGIMNTVLIYNAFDIGKFQFEREELERFKVRNGLTGRPVIYIGNCRNEKGARTVWNALRDQRYQLVSSGISNIDLPIRKFLLPYREYLLLLAASSVVVTLSEFEEGWNRTAHEALLCRTPVIGSGSGGMGELLQNGGQLICQNQAALSSMVDSALEQRADLSDKGFAFAREFTIERFRHQWIELIASLN